MCVIDLFARYQANFYQKTNLESKIHTAASAAMSPLVAYMAEWSLNLYFWYVGTKVIPFKCQFNYESWFVLYLVYSTAFGYMLSNDYKTDNNYRISRYLEYISRIA